MAMTRSSPPLAVARAVYPDAPQHEAATKFLHTEEGQGPYTLRDTLEASEAAGVTFDKLHADAQLECYAAGVLKRDSSLTLEQACVRAMEEHPDVAAEERFATPGARTIGGPEAVRHAAQTPASPGFPRPTTRPPVAWSSGLTAIAL